MYQPPLRIIMAIFLICALLLLSFFHSFVHLRPQDWHLNIFVSTEERKTQTYDFKHTAEEDNCLSDMDTLSNPIPNVVHFLWGFKNPEMTFMNYLTIQSALIALKPNTLKLHYEDLNTDNIWFKKLHNNITLVHHDMPSEYPKQIKEKWQVSHLSDALRLDVLQREGGVYMDMDIIALRSFDTIRNSSRDVVLGHEGGDRHGFCNAIILARKNASFLDRWIKSYVDFDPKNEWNYHSVLLPKKIAVEHPGLVCPLAPEILFWPTWTNEHIRYMHEPITKDEAREVELHLDANDGALYPDQLAYHAWGQMARSKYISHLTPEIVRDEDTRFNIMVRRFL